MEGSYILRLLRDVSRVRRWRLAAGEGRESRRVVAEAVRSDLHVLTHTYTHLRTRVSVTAGAVTHALARMQGARGRRTGRRTGGEDPRGPESRRRCLVVQRTHLGRPERPNRYMHGTLTRSRREQRRSRRHCPVRNRSGVGLWTFGTSRSHVFLSARLKQNWVHRLGAQFCDPR